MESPTFLLLRKRHEEAATALRRLRGPHYDVMMEMNQVIKHINESQETRSHFRDIFQWNYLKPVGLLYAAILGSLNGVYGGFDVGFASVGIPSLEKDKDAPFTLTTEVKALFVSIVTLGEFLGSLVSALIAKRWSRKWLLITLLFPLLATWIMVAYPLNLFMFMTARALHGIFFGIQFPISQLYVAEISHKDQRGLLTSGNMVCMAFATMLAYILGMFMDWRAFALTLGLIPIALVPTLIFVPESPTFLLLHKRQEEAAAALRRLRGPHYDITTEMDQIDDHTRPTPPIPQTQVAPQGDSLSPLLFTLYTCNLIKQLKSDATLTNHPINLLLYADDTVIYSRHHAANQVSLDSIKKWSSANEIQINTSKTQIMKFRRGGHLASTDEFLYNGTKVQIVPANEYLGVAFQSKGF
ncbi:unnamed protein product [Darwinula stevensoni]|uniref:Major facilitator superfamily (MFS) profile domain-containing protein n=1 Tax=Darwinula stevensoni TaxID=69355 RepID=A0A7R9FQQ4_9CRUS|nr:unnamed protein product [Darwinula stevensoni]CAG0899584.1 unnamed protein product [Darwinula stevensoni]